MVDLTLLTKEECFELGRKSAIDRIQQGRRKPGAKPMGRPKGARDKRKHNRPKTKIYKYKLFNSKPYRLIKDRTILVPFNEKVKALDLIDKKTYDELKKELDELWNKDVIKLMEGVKSI